MAEGIEAQASIAASSSVTFTAAPATRRPDRCVSSLHCGVVPSRVHPGLYILQCPAIERRSSSGCGSSICTRIATAAWLPNFCM